MNWGRAVIYWPSVRFPISCQDIIYEWDEYKIIAHIVFVPLKNNRAKEIIHAVYNMCVMFATYTQKIDIELSATRYHNADNTALHCMETSLYTTLTYFLLSVLILQDSEREIYKQINLPVDLYNGKLW